MAQPVGTLQRNSQRKLKYSIRQIVTDSFLELPDGFLDRSVTFKRFKQGAECLVAFNCDKPVGYMWFVSPHYFEEEDRSLFRLDHSMLWDFDFYIEPKFRFGGLFMELWYYADDLFCQKRIDFTISRVAASNYRSLGSHQRLGARPIGWILYLGFFSVQLSISTMRPFIHLSLSTRSFPEFSIDHKRVSEKFLQDISAEK